MRSNALLGLVALPLAMAVSACSDSPAGALGPTQLPAMAESGGQASSGQAAPALLGVWKLVEIEKAGQQPQRVPAPEKFTADFSAGGRLSIVSDCNRCAGGYDATASTLTVGPAACTLAACTTSPLDTDFTALLSQASSWQVSGSQLTLRSAKGRLLMAR